MLLVTAYKTVCPTDAEDEENINYVGQNPIRGGYIICFTIPEFVKMLTN